MTKDLHFSFTSTGLQLDQRHGLPLNFPGIEKVVLHTAQGPIQVSEAGESPAGFSQLPTQSGTSKYFHPRSAGASTADYVAWILAQQSGPLSNAEISQRLHDETAGGRVPSTTLHAALSRDSRFIKVHRGQWDLAQCPSSPDTTPSPEPAANHVPKTITLHCVLHGYPKLWRRLELPSTTTLFDLHRALQLAFGWSGEHLNQFTIGERHYEADLPGSPLLGDILDARQYTIGQTFTVDERATYLYDWSVHWRVHLDIVGVSLVPPAGQPIICTAGEAEPIPETIFGEDTYAELLKTRRQQPESEEGRKAAELLCPDHQPDAFDLPGLNQQLARL